MFGKGISIGLVVVCVGVLSVAFVPSAWAGGRAYECTTAAAVKQFKDAHCVQKVETGGTLGHLLLSEKTPTPISLSNEKTKSETREAETLVIRGKVTAGTVAVEFQCVEASGTGELTNSPAFTSGTATLTYSKCWVTKPEEKGCVIKGGEGKISTNKLRLTSSGLAANQLKVEQFDAETPIALVTLEKCGPFYLNTTYQMTGSYIATTSGAITSTTLEALTAQGTVKLDGTKMGLEGKLTIKRTSNGNGIVLT